ncbi:MAG: cupin domain-containing protein [Candidatus Colwellbacteria bacterium]|nr:cupin domain-containing protein [Candidatus Colwellbacteria bacterium]
MNLREYKKKAVLLRNTSVYRVYDLGSLKRLNLSLTELKPHQATGGHSHKSTDEVYFFSGPGIMENGSKKEKVKAGDVALVPQGNFHKVYNKSNNLLRFWTAFVKYKGREGSKS